MIYSEQNVDIPAGTKSSDVYDLALFFEMGSTTRAVLVVTVIISFKFKDGVGSNQVRDETGLRSPKLIWTAKEKKAYMEGVRTELAAAWGEQHRLTTTSKITTLTDAGVIFDIRTAENMSVFSHSHWNATVTKVDQFEHSTTDDFGNSPISNGELVLNSQGLTGLPRGGPGTQRSVIHEFGHMLGFRDEYPSAPDSNTVWNWDKSSVMWGGEDVRDRHYVFFADWISRQGARQTSLSKPNDWKVNGIKDLSNAML